MHIAHVLIVKFSTFDWHSEFPAVLLNFTTGRTLSEFHQFVRPRNHPKLSKFCLGLTGITQLQIDRAKSFPEVFHDFLDWLDRITIQNKLVFHTMKNRQHYIGQNASFCSWSSNDLEHFFQFEMDRHKLDRSDSMAVWIDFQHEYKVFPFHEMFFLEYSISINRMAFSDFRSFRSNIKAVWDSIVLCNAWTFVKKVGLIRASPMHGIWQNSCWKWVEVDQKLRSNVLNQNRSGHL